MKLLHKKHLKEENYNFQRNIEKEESVIKNNTNTTVFQILIWSVIVALIVVIFNKYFIN